MLSFIDKLKTNISQPKATVDGDSKDSLRQDPLAKYLILACPFDVNGIDQGRGDKIALIYDSPITGNKKQFTYNLLKEKVSKFACARIGEHVAKLL